MPKQRRTVGKARTAGKIARVLLAICALLAAVAAFAIEEVGGQYGIPTWSELYRYVGLDASTTEADAATEGTTVTVLDVGQGSATLIEQDNEYCLIDTGTADTKQLLVNRLHDLGVRKLKLLVLTHPHSDHIGGATAVLENFEVEQILLTSLTFVEEGSGWQERIFSLINANNIAAKVPTAGETYPVGSGTLTVLQANFMDPNALTADDSENDKSICTMFTAGDFHCLCTGDAEASAEQALAGQYGSALKTTVLVAGHHGSYTSTTKEFLAVVKPRAVAISCGVSNDYGHPHEVTLRRIAATNADVYRTDTMGDITFSYENGNLEVTTSIAQEVQHKAA